MLWDTAGFKCLEIRHLIHTMQTPAPRHAGSHAQHLLRSRQIPLIIKGSIVLSSPFEIWGYAGNIYTSRLLCQVYSLPDTMTTKA